MSERTSSPKDKDLSVTLNVAHSASSGLFLWQHCANGHAETVLCVPLCRRFVSWQVLGRWGCVSGCTSFVCLDSVHKYSHRHTRTGRKAPATTLRLHTHTHTQAAMNSHLHSSSAKQQARQTVSHRDYTHWC